ncbi:MAG: hypothetical protein QOH78_224, partial [Verrucomicrobiota bacterium]
MRELPVSEESCQCQLSVVSEEPWTSAQAFSRIIRKTEIVSTSA